MTPSELKALLEVNPDPEVEGTFQAEIAASLDYLASGAALSSLHRDAYWPKWHSPWWHMLVLHEMGLTREIPEVAVEAMVAALQRLPIKFFPLHNHELDPGWNPYVDASCHCAVGSITSVLSAWGVEVDRELPWLRQWLPLYQMSDGGKSCDAEAYQVEGECPSSMVGLIAPLEAMLYHRREWDPHEIEFLDQGAEFLMRRELRLGSGSSFNAEEREAAPNWLLPCFPRLYFYDVLRGLRTLLTWSLKRRRTVSLNAVSAVLEHLVHAFPDGQVRCQRLSYAGVGTLLPSDGGWTRQPTASTFPLLEATSRLGTVSLYLTHQWSECKRLALQLLFKPVVLVPPDLGWAQQAEEEGRRLAALLGDNLIRAHHIGSTSIPGIWAKPIIDLAPEVRSLEKLDELKETLLANGYEYWGEYGLPGRRFCPRLDDRQERAANIHCYQTGDPGLHRHLAFRDYLRNHPAVAAEYEREKLHARDLHPLDVFAYNDEKNSWIRRVELEALDWSR